MYKPAVRQWVVLWIGVIWIVITLGVAEEYVMRGVFAALIVTALLFWQLAPRPILDAPGQSDDSGPHRDPNSNGVKPSDPGPVGVSGWLAFFNFGLIVTVISMIQQVSTSAANTVERAQFIGALIALVAFAVFALVVLALILTKSANAPRVTRWFIGIFTVVAVYGTFETAGKSETFSFTVGRTFPIFVWAIIWAAYFEKSRRVKNTFVRESAAGDVSTAGRQKAMRFSAISIALFAAALLWFGTFSYERTQQRYLERFNDLTFYDVLKSTFATDAGFIDGFTKAVKTRLQKEIENGTITITDDAVFEDLGTAYRGVVGYSAEVASNAKDVMPFVGQVRSYFHPDGLVQIEGFCKTDELECSGMTKLYEAAEKNLLSRLSGTQLAGILPDGDCSLQAVDLPDKGGSIQTVQCYYTKTRAAFLSISRQDKDETKRAFQDRMPADDQFKREVVRRVRGGE